MGCEYESNQILLPQLLQRLKIIRAPRGKKFDSATRRNHNESPEKEKQ